MKTRTNVEWLRELTSGGEDQAIALSDLRAYLLRAARYALHRQRRLFAHASSVDLDQFAEDCAQEALLAILEQLSDFRGASRFTTWAYKFAINMALVTARREAWKHVSLDALLQQADGPAWLAEVDSTVAGDPERTARLAEAWTVVRSVIEQDLSERQRRALKIIAGDGVPLDELVRHWGSSRNAIYKLLHDARHKLKARLEARGCAPRELLALFSESG